MAKRTLILKAVFLAACVSACTADNLSTHISGGGLRSDSAGGEMMGSIATPHLSSLRHTAKANNVLNGGETVVMALSDDSQYPSPSAKSNSWRFDLRQVAGYTTAFSLNGVGSGASGASNCAMCAMKRSDSLNMCEDECDRISLRLDFGAHSV